MRLNYYLADTALAPSCLRHDQFVLQALQGSASQLCDQHLYADLHTMIEMVGRLVKNDQTIALKLTKHGPANRLTSCLSSSLLLSLSISKIENVTD